MNNVNKLPEKEEQKCREIAKVQKDVSGRTHEEYDIISIKQFWKNASGGFEEMGDSIITREYTHIAVTGESQRCFVYFKEKFAYSADFTKDFALDISRRTIKGLKHCYIYKNVRYSG